MTDTQAKPKGFYVSFDTAPPVGTKITYTHGRVFTLRRVGVYTNRFGDEVPLLEWEGPGGEIGTTGLKGKGMYWRSIEEARIARQEASMNAVARAAAQ